MSPDPAIRQALCAALESLHAAGVTHLPWPADLPAPETLFSAPPRAPAARTAEPRPAAIQGSTAIPAPERSSSRKPPTAAPSRAAQPAAPPPLLPVIGGNEPWPPPFAAPDRPALLDALRVEVAACTRCAELVRCRSRTVFGVGSPSARLCLVGEAPGADEDRLGEPFVGAAGQLLDRILTACRLSRGEVYILNVLKCRPPQNRTPLDSEMANCWGYATRQLEIIQPEFICCLGSVAAKAVLGGGQSISRLRGQFHSYRGSRVLVTYHPAYLLRTPSAKVQTWEDMKLLMRTMGRPVD